MDVIKKEASLLKSLLSNNYNFVLLYILYNIHNRVTICMINKKILDK